jgi:Ca2+/Na+ antiporter
MRLRRMGMVITSHIRPDLRPPMPPVPSRVRIFQLSTLMDVMLILAALIIGIVHSARIVPAYWTNSIANTLNPAQVGSTLLSQFGFISSFTNWLNPLRMIGMAFVFTGITIALTVIIGTLRQQAGILVKFYNQASNL